MIDLADPESVDRLGMDAYVRTCFEAFTLVPAGMAGNAGSNTPFGALEDTYKDAIVLAALSGNLDVIELLPPVHQARIIRFVIGQLADHLAGLVEEGA